MALHDELERFANDRRPRSRANLGETHRWLAENPNLAVGAFAVLGFAGVASAMSWLKWEAAAPRWSFAVLAWCLGLYVLQRAWVGFTTER